MKRLIKCLQCGLRYDAEKHQSCPACIKQQAGLRSAPRTAPKKAAGVLLQEQGQDQPKEAPRKEAGPGDERHDQKVRRTLEAWNDPATGDAYLPRYPPFNIYLTATATKAMYAAALTKHSKKRSYLLLCADGSLRPGKNHFESFTECLSIAIKENRLIFNARSRATSRIVWYQPQALMRKPNQWTYEGVKLIPELTALKDIDGGPRAAMVRKTFGLEKE